MSGFRREVHEKCVLGYYAASGRNFLPTFRVNISVPSSNYRNCVRHNCALLDYYAVRSGRVLMMGPAGYPKTSVRKYHYTLRNSLEERSSGVGFVSTIPVIWNNTPSCREPHNYWFTADYWRNLTSELRNPKSHISRNVAWRHLTQMTTYTLVAAHQNS